MASNDPYTPPASLPEESPDSLRPTLANNSLLLVVLPLAASAIYLQMNRDSDPARRSFPPQFIYRASGQDKGGARLRTKLERLTARPHLVFDRPPQHDMDKMLYVLVLWNHTSRH